jgi:cytochrome c55X
MNCKPVLVFAATASVLTATAAEPPAPRRAQLVELVRQDCGACHGMTLKGGLGPPLLPAALAGKPDASLEAVILNGRPGTPMPPWRGFMTEDEVRWIVESLKKGFPRDR